MAFASFGDGGYSYCDEGRYVLFDDDRKHYRLLDYYYKSKEVSRLPALLESYVSCKLDVESFELTGCKGDSKEIDEVIGILKSLHKYYEHEYKKVFVKAIGDYLNDLLISSRTSIEREKYINTFMELSSPVYSPHTCEDVKIKASVYHDDYKKRMGGYQHPSVEETLIYRPPVVGFFNELETHTAIKRALFWIFDISIPSISELPATQRAWLCEQMFHTSLNPGTKVSKHLLFSPIELFRAGHDRSYEAERAYEIQNISNTLYTLGDNDTNDENASLEILEALNAAADYAKANSKTVVCEEYEIDSLRQLLFIELMQMIKDNIKIRNCKNCGKYYVVTNRRIVYCDRLVDGEGSKCFSIGSKQTFQKKVETDRPLKLYDRAYRTHHARYRNGSMDKDEFKTWGAEAKEYLGKVRVGEMDIVAFEEWLKK